MDSGKHDQPSPCYGPPQRRDAGRRRFCCCLAWLWVLSAALVALAAPTAKAPGPAPSLRPVARVTAGLRLANPVLNSGNAPLALTDRLLRDGAEQPDSPLSLATWSGTHFGPIGGRTPGPAAAAAASLANTRATVAMARDVLGALLASAVERSSALWLLTDGQHLRLLPVFRARGFGVKVALAW
ncbi:MAG: hypothetical protein IPG96_13960 [Proteobacteria bacterium]|nr:hypothetical protein [Pseudomonadota bacterium]